MFITIILPTYNESKNIVNMLQDIYDTLDGKYTYNVIVVDDNSPDNTYNIAFHEARYLKYKDKITVLKRKGKLGLGTAYKYGLAHVNRKSDWVIFMDADGSHPVHYIKDFIIYQKKYNADIINGSRYMEGGKVVNWPLKRRIISKTANFLARLILRTKRSDLTGSYRMYRRNVLKELMGNMDCSGFAFGVELICKAERKGYKIVDVPICFKDRKYGESKLSIHDIMGFIRMLFKNT